jgi:hypothetical protein
VRVQGAAYLRGVADDLALVARALVRVDVADLPVLEAAGPHVRLRQGLPPYRKAVVEDEEVQGPLRPRVSLITVASVIPTPAPIAVYTTFASAIPVVLLADRPQLDKHKLAL